MNVLHQGYWIGQSLSYVPKDTLFHIEHYFQIKEFGFDVSVLSDPEIQFCFFFHESEHENALLNTSIKICDHLRKKLIILHNGFVEEKNLVSDSVLNSYNLKQGDILTWIEKLSTQLFYHFSHFANQESPLNQQNRQEFALAEELNSDLVEILGYIEKNLSRTIREEDVAEYCHYSVSYFSKVFHNAIGMTFRDYVIQKRIGLAKQLLKEDKKTKVAFIAFQCGYKDVSYFTRIFKKKTGVTPANYRHST